jgi:hypothetical protein
MRKLILFLLICISAKVNAQVYQEMPQYGYRANRMAFDSTLQIPTVCGVPTIKSVVKYTKNGAIAYDSCNAVFYTYNPKTLTWTAVSGGGGSTDTTSLSNRINLKVNISDTSNMLTKYLRKTDTASLSNRINLKVPYTGATQDVDLGAFKISAQSFQVEGTNGLGHIHFKHQNSDATATGQSTVLYANSNGDLKYKNAGNYYSTLKTQQTADRVYTFQNKSYTLADSSDLSAKLNTADTLSLSNRINLKLNIADTSLLQSKSIQPYSFLANNTTASANAQALPFKDTSGTYTGSIAWNGTAPASGNLTYRWTRIGKMVTINISLVYANAGSANSTLTVALPSDAPTPSKPAGLTSALNNLYPIVGSVNITNQSTLTNSGTRGFLRNNTANNGFEFNLGYTATTAVNAFITCTYYTD